jgi:hypothetical protein
MILLLYGYSHTIKMDDTPKTRKGSNGKKKDQRQKGSQEHRLGNSKYVRQKEAMMQNNKTKMER